MRIYGKSTGSIQEINYHLLGSESEVGSDSGSA